MSEPVIYSFENNGISYALDFSHCVSLIRYPDKVMTKFSNGDVFNFTQQKAIDDVYKAFEKSKKISMKQVFSWRD